MAFSPQARAWVVQMIAEWRETRTKYTFTGEPRPDAGVGVWRPGYVPEGFEEIERLDTPGLGYVASILLMRLWIRAVSFPMIMSTANIWRQP